MTSENLMKEEKSSMPVFKIKVGYIDVAVWSNDNNDGSKYFTISYAKSYLDSNKEWQKTNNLSVNDIPNLQIAMQKAYEYVKIRE